MNVISRMGEELKSLIGAKLLKIKPSPDGTQFVLEFDNNRTFTGHLNLDLQDSKIEAGLRIFCGYHGKHLDLREG